MERVTPEDIRFCVTQAVSAYEKVNRFDLERHLFDKARTQIANRLVHEHMRLTKHNHYWEYKMEVYVASPEVFWQLVQEEAMRINRQMNLNSMGDSSGTN